MVKPRKAKARPKPKARAKPKPPTKRQVAIKAGFANIRLDLYQAEAELRKKRDPSDIVTLLDITSVSLMRLKLDINPKDRRST